MSSLEVLALPEMIVEARVHMLIAIMISTVQSIAFGTILTLIVIHRISIKMAMF